MIDRWGNPSVSFCPNQDKSENEEEGEKSDKAEYDHPSVDVRYSSLKWNRFSSTKGSKRQCEKGIIPFPESCFRHDEGRW